MVYQYTITVIFNTKRDVSAWIRLLKELKSCVKCVVIRKKVWQKKQVCTK